MKDIADYALKKLEELNVNYAEVKLETKEENAFVLKNGNLDVSGFDKISGLGIRYLINNNLGFISLNDLNKDTIKRLIEKSVRITNNAGKISEKIYLSDDDVSKKSYEVKEKFKIKDFTSDKKIGYLIQLDKDLKDIYMRFFSLSDSITEKYFITTEGAKIESKIPRVHFYSYLTIMQDGKTRQRYTPYGATSGYECLKFWNLNEKLNNENLVLKDNIKSGIKVKQGVYDVICGNEVTGIAVHESAGHPYEADRIFGREAAQAGESFVTEKMVGEIIGNEKVNVVDDPTLENSYGYYLYDDEGVKARRKFIIKEGKINEFLHNRETAYSMNLKSNGSARASDYDKENMVRMSNTFMLGGDSSEDEIIRETKKGVFLKNFMEWNIDDKRYQQKYVGCEAFLVENGEITKPLISPALEITTPAFWKAIDMIGKEVKHFAGSCGKGEPMQGIPVWMGGPVIRLKNIGIK
ncbi:MAG: TldD/PmbA family protein [Nanoarchaeota archaeon]|nr:TldD/PmbA family protein [Nanoarchaeota archaeon]